MGNQIRAIHSALTEWVEARAPREKRLLGAGGALLAVALIYSVLWAPAWNECERIQASLPLLQAQVAQVQAQLEEVRHVKGDAAPQAPQGPALRDALAESIAQAGIPTPQFTVVGQGVQVDAKNVSFAAWMSWLDEIRRTDRARVVSAHATGELQAGHATVSVTVQPASAP